MDEVDEDDHDRESTVLRAAMVAAAERASTRQLEHTAPATVLLADDDDATRDLVASALRDNGFEVVPVPSGQAAVERVAAGGIDVVLVDAVMPGMSGVETAVAIKAVEQQGFTPVVLVLARTDTQSRVEGLRAGVDGYVCKPMEETELVMAVVAALRARRAHEQLRAAEARLARVRSTDALTGVFSFHWLHARLREEFDRADRHQEPLACCLVDVDRLKVYNERGGRAMGDAVLRAVAGVVGRSLRESDVVARYGGDEFFVMLPATHFAGSLVVAERIWRDVATEPLALDSDAGRLTASVGVAMFPSRDVRSMDELLNALESALLEAKRRGGNRLCVFQQKGFIYTPEGITSPEP